MMKKSRGLLFFAWEKKEVCVLLLRIVVEYTENFKKF